jgi:hypothetical protein
MRKVFTPAIAAGLFVVALSCESGGQTAPRPQTPVTAYRGSSYPAIDRRTASNSLPAVHITGPDTASPGDLIVVAAEIDKTNLPANLLLVQYQWTVLYNGRVTQQYLPWPDGTRVVMSAGRDAGNYTVVLNANFLFGTEQKSTPKAYSDVDVGCPDPMVKQIAVGTAPAPTPPPYPTPPPNPTPIPPPNPTPTPPPNPTPPPDPTPSPLPDGQFGLAKTAYGVMMNSTTLPGDERVKLAKALSTGFKSVAAKIAAVQTMPRDIASLIALTQSTNDAAISQSGVPIGHTLGVKQALGDYVYPLIYGPTPTIVNADALAQAWREIATGLDAVH